MANITHDGHETIGTTPTQPQLNSKVGFDMQITLDHHPPPSPHKLKVINISTVPDPILDKNGITFLWDGKKVTIAYIVLPVTKLKVGVNLRLLPTLIW